jgi:phosphoribosylformylglycinamidine synthase PurS subunit
MNFVAEVVVTLRPVINDPQGLVVRDGLAQLGFDGVTAVRVGKHIEIELSAASSEAAEADVQRMCEKLLRNPVIEDYRITVREAQGVSA